MNDTHVCTQPQNTFPSLLVIRWRFYIIHNWVYMTIQIHKLKSYEYDTRYRIFFGRTDAHAHAHARTGPGTVLWCWFWGSLNLVVCPLRKLWGLRIGVSHLHNNNFPRAVYGWSTLTAGHNRQNLHVINISCDIFTVANIAITCTCRCTRFS